MPDSERKVIFRHIQDFQVEQLKVKQAKEENFNIRVLGWTVLCVGLIITIGSFLFNPSVTVIAYGAILYGLYVLMRRKLNPIDEDNGTKKRSMFDKGLFNKF